MTKIEFRKNKVFLHSEGAVIEVKGDLSRYLGEYVTFSEDTTLRDFLNKIKETSLIKLISLNYPTDSIYDFVQRNNSNTVTKIPKFHGLSLDSLIIKADMEVNPVSSLGDVDIAISWYMYGLSSVAHEDMTIDKRFKIKKGSRQTFYLDYLSLDQYLDLSLNITTTVKISDDYELEIFNNKVQINPPMLFEVLNVVFSEIASFGTPEERKLMIEKDSSEINGNKLSGFGDLEKYFENK